MWGRSRKADGAENGAAQQPHPLKDALRQVRVDNAERSSVVVDLRDAEVARLELLNDALDPAFAEVPPEIDIFDRAISHGDVPRLWIDVIAYVAMGRDKRAYRFMQETRFGPKVLLESADVKETADAVTRYVAGRIIERERALVSGAVPGRPMQRTNLRRRRAWRAFRYFLLGLVVGIAGLIVLALMVKP